MATAPQQPQVFISYQRTDEPFAQQVREHLVAHGFRTWMDHYNIPVGAYWPDAIDEGLTESEIVVGILSPDAMASRNVKNEWDWAIQNGKRLLLLQVQPTVIPHRYVSINFIDATADHAAALAALLDALGIPTDAGQVPVTQYALSGTVNIAYQVLGTGPRDLLLVPGFVSHVEVIWEEPLMAGFLRWLASFGRLIMFDKRGTGMSDRVAEADLPTLEQRMDDARAVLDAAGSTQTVVLGMSEGGPMGVLFAATYPERTLGLLLYGSFATVARFPDYPWGETPAAFAEYVDAIRRNWGTPASPEIERMAPSTAGNARLHAWFERYRRLGASPGAAAALELMNHQIDVRDLLPTIRVPTMVLHRTGDRDVRIEHGRYLARHIPGAQLVEVPGDDHFPMVGDTAPIREAIQTFVTQVCLTPSGEDAGIPA